MITTMKYMKNTKTPPEEPRTRAPAAQTNHWEWPPRIKPHVEQEDSSNDEKINCTQASKKNRRTSAPASRQGASTARRRAVNKG